MFCAILSVDVQQTVVMVISEASYTKSVNFSNPMFYPLIKTPPQARGWHNAKEKIFRFALSIAG